MQYTMFMVIVKTHKFQHGYVQVETSRDNICHLNRSRDDYGVDFDQTTLNKFTGSKKTR